MTSAPHTTESAPRPPEATAALRVAVIGPHMGEWIPLLRSLLTTPVEIIWVSSYEEEEVTRAVPDVDVVITASFTPAMGRACRRARLVQMPGAGYDKIHPDSIPPGALFANCYEHENAMAEWVLMMCLALSRQLIQADAQLRQGDWSLFPGSGAAPFVELTGQVMGLIGLGRVGRATVRLAHAFGMRCIGIDSVPISPAAAADIGLEWAGGTEDLDRVLRTSDHVVVAVPLLDSTRGLIGERELGLMKRTAYLINPARGPIVDEKALFEALSTRQIAGAGLDAWYNYPKAYERLNPARYPIHALPNVVITPHTSGWTKQTIERRCQVVAANVDRLARGEPLVGVVPEMSKAGSTSKGDF